MGEKVQVYIPVDLPCGCRVYFGPTLDNKYRQPLRGTCQHNAWQGTFYPDLRIAQVGKIVTRVEQVKGYPVKPLTWGEMYADRYGA